MPDFTAKDVQALRQSTGAGMMDAKKALQENGGDFDAATKWLREKGLAKSATREDRDNSQGTVAVATAVFLWLTLVFVSDLGLMAGALALKLRIQELFALSLLNPLQVFKMWSLHAIDATLDVLGPAGLYATEEFGPRLHLAFAAALAAWVVAPLVVASVIFARRSPV